MQLVCFYLGDQEFGTPIDDVRETIGLRPMTHVFRTPPSVAGIINLRGEIVAVLDPGVLLGLPPARIGEETRIVIVEPDERTAGLLADRVGSIREVEDETLGPVPDTVPPPIAAMLRGVISLPERPVGVLDCAKLLSAPQLLRFAKPDAVDRTVPMESR
jgi:purine-binding chemotaxis protein CheW